jgi:hypothetical protein
MGSTSIEQPNPPAQPSTADAINAWVQSMPQVYETQMKYAPLEAAQQVQLAQQYAQPLGEAYQQAQSAMYPETSALQEKMAGMASEGMESGVPDWMRNEYLSNMRAQLGEQAASRIGADSISTGLMGLQEDWKRYYQDMGLSLAGRQPLSQPASPSYSNYMGGYTPQSNMSYMANTYAPYASAYSSMYNTNAAMQQQANNVPFQIMGGLGGMMMGAGSMMNPGMAAASSIRFKKNVKPWVKH